MMSRISRCALLGVALLCISSPAAFADATVAAPDVRVLAVSAFALQSPLAPELAVLAPGASASEATEVTLAGVAYRPIGRRPYAHPAVVYSPSPVVYRPKGSGMPPDDVHHQQSASQIRTVTQIYGGRMDPDGSTDGEFLMGIRTGPKLSKHLQLGLMFDWVRDSDYESSFTTSTPGPGGVNITTKYDYSGAYTDLFPLMAFAQVSLNEKRFIAPYGGIGGGYQWFNVTAYDRNGTWYDANFGGWGWLGWAGAALRVTDGVRLSGELMYNSVELSRNVYDPVNGWTNHETVPMYGVGARFGLAFGF
jgi:hypothetical protein